MSIREAPGGALLEWEFESPRLFGRRFQPGDGALLAALDSDPEVMRYLSGGPGTPLRVIEDQILPRILGEYSMWPGCGTFAVHERESGEFAGWVSLRRHEEAPSTAELGYRFRRQYWGRGFATEACRALLTRGFSDTALVRVVATTYGENAASRRVMERLGMTFVRAFRPSPEELSTVDSFQPGDGDPWDGDDVEYAIGRQAWLQLQTPGTQAHAPGAVD